MRYDSENGIIRISVKELVMTAKRGISSGASDDGEPGGRSRRRALNCYLPEGACEKELSLETASERRFLVYGKTYVIDKEIYLFGEWESGSKKPGRADIAEARGEGFILAYMLARELSLSSVTITIVYINENTGGRVTTKEAVDIKKLELFFKKCTSLLAEYAEPEINRVTVRIPSMKEARFPYGKVREGQSEFISTVYRNLTRGGTLFAMAPTGTGKTVSVLYPAVRALGAERCDKVFYFTPKTTTAVAAKECIEEMCAHGVKIKAVILNAKERICKRGVLCRDGKDHCPSVKDGTVVRAAVKLFESDKPVITEAELLYVAAEFDVCPHELSLTYSELCDIVICDINYLFDPRVYIKRYFLNGGRFAFLVDEAHNLPDRAREMYSAEISAEEIAEPYFLAEIGEHSALHSLSRICADRVKDLLLPYVSDEIRRDKDGSSHAFAHISEPPSELYEIFTSLTETAEAEMLSALRSKSETREQALKSLRDYLAKVKRVNDTLASFDGGYEMFITLTDGQISFKLFCIDTSAPISERLAKGHATVFFSATLAPLSYYRSVLGGDRSASVLEIASPFDSSQLSVSVMDRISTRWSEREDTLNAVSRSVAACVSAKRGHYMVFSPSFAYSEALAENFCAKYPKINVLKQTRDMTKAQKRAFLEEFEKNPETYLVAFCVTGGIFSEGIDLVGDSLIGAVVVGIAMPSLTPEREAIAAYYDEKCDEGKLYAYIYPGMNRVFQAAGRVIRREGDKGVVVLIDDRFADPVYKKSIPDLWADMEFSSDPKALKDRLEKFWSTGKKVPK